MKTVKVIAKQQHVYAQVTRKTGETYDIDEQHLALFEHIGHVEKVEAGRADIVDRELTPDPPKGRYQTRVMRPPKE